MKRGEASGPKFLRFEYSLTRILGLMSLGTPVLHRAHIYPAHVSHGTSNSTLMFEENLNTLYFPNPPEELLLVVSGSPSDTLEPATSKDIPKEYEIEQPLVLRTQ